MSEIFTWICLVLVASTTAYGLQLTTAAMVPPAAASQSTSATLTRKVLIVEVDPVTGAIAQVDCGVPANSVASDVILVNASEFPTVAQVCILADA